MITQSLNIIVGTLSEIFALSIMFYDLFLSFYMNREFTKGRLHRASTAIVRNCFSAKDDKWCTMRLCIFTFILFVLGIILSSWCPTHAMASSKPEAQPRYIYIITHRPKKHRIITITRRPVKLTEIYLKN